MVGDERQHFLRVALKPDIYTTVGIETRRPGQGAEPHAECIWNDPPHLRPGHAAPAQETADLNSLVGEPEPHRQEEVAYGGDEEQAGKQTEKRTPQAVARGKGGGEDECDRNRRLAGVTTNEVEGEGEAAVRQRVAPLY